jgi:hypothetical protein
MVTDLNCKFECEFKSVCIDECNYHCENYQNCSACIQDGKYENCIKIGTIK